MANNIRLLVESFHRQHPNKLQFISGKWFDEKNNEINNIDKYLFELALDKDYRHFFVFFRKTSDIHEFEELFITAYGSNGIWHLPKYARDIDIHKKIEQKDLAFPLTYEQALIIGVMLFRPEEECFFICTGVGGSGKSTFGNIVKQLFNNDVSNTSLDDLHGFKLAEAVKRRLIYSEEISNKELNCSNLKMLASKQEITVEPKYLVPYDTKTQSVILMNCNRTPPIDILDTGITRRLIFYRRDIKIVNPDTSIRKRVYTEKELLDFATFSYQCIKDCPDWREVFRKDTFQTVMKDNRAYKYYKEGAKTYEAYKTKCWQDDVDKRYIMSEKNWNGLVDYIQENDDDEKLPF